VTDNNDAWWKPEIDPVM